MDRRKFVVLFGGDTTFTPASLSADLWLDPSDLTTLFQDAAGATPVAANNDPSRLITNKGSATFNMTAPSDAARPLYKTSGGLHWLESDGTDDQLTSAAAISSILTASVFDFFVGFRFIILGTDVADATAYENDSIFNVANGWLCLAARSTGPRLQCMNFDSNADVAGITGAPFAQDADLVARLTHSGGDLTITLNNGTPVTVTSGNTGAVTDLIKLFSNYNDTAFTQARLYGLICRRTVFTSSEAANLWTYMAAKSGVTL